MNSVRLLLNTEKMRAASNAASLNARPVVVRIVVRAGFRDPSFPRPSWQGDAQAGHYDDAVFEDLRAWRAHRAAQGYRSVCPTRQTPKRAAELLEGGSLYWVIKGQVLVRQAIDEIVTEDSGHQPCRIYLKPELIETAPQPRRAFQGWRYLTAADAPPDLVEGESGDLPTELALKLRELGAW